jgi:hypothetical protein
MAMRLILVLLVALFAQSVTAQQKVQLPKALVEDAFKKAECEVELDEAIKDLETTGELSGGLHLVEVPCWRAAYNFGSILFALDPAAPEKARLLSLQRPEKNKLASTYQLSAPDYNGKTKILGSFHKGRGVGDCGSSGEWRWNGKDFELKRYWNKDQCDGQVFDTETQSKRYLVYPFRKKN